MSRIGALWVRLAVLSVAFVGQSHADDDNNLAKAIREAATEAEAKELLEPHLGNVKSLDGPILEGVVLRQWWDLAREIVALSHVQQTDLSNTVRQAVRSLKEEADELLRTLNPKYGQAQVVSPSFQWAQNDTCVFLTVKFTVRWNSPGALEVAEPAVAMSGNTFNFTGLGKHSNNKYKYVLSLAAFDNIVPEASVWSLASVGKLSVTLRKRWARKWPRLLADKKLKIGNMHVWMEQQEKLDAALHGMHTVSHSPVTCLGQEKLYCLSTDSCKKGGNCTQCAGKSFPDFATGLCTGIPGERASITFKDTDMDEHQIGGEIKVNKARNEFDIDSYKVYWGKGIEQKLEPEETALLGSLAPTGSTVDLKIPQNTPIPESATHLLVFSENSFGQLTPPGFVMIKDAVLPKGKAKSVSFEDEDGDRSEVSGTLAIEKADDEEKIQDYSVHWGKNERRKVSLNSHLKDVSKGTSPLQYKVPTSTKVPDGATHLLVFSKNEFGENPNPTSMKLVDNTKPCIQLGEEDCPRSITSSVDLNPDPKVATLTVSIEQAVSEQAISGYMLYWGRRGCEEGGQSGAKNGFVVDVSIDEAKSVELADVSVPEGSTHLLAFSKNRHGESAQCVDMPLAVEPTKTEL